MMPPSPSIPTVGNYFWQPGDNVSVANWKGGPRAYGQGMVHEEYNPNSVNALKPKVYAFATVGQSPAAETNWALWLTLLIIAAFIYFNHRATKAEMAPAAEPLDYPSDDLEAAQARFGQQQQRRRELSPEGRRPFEGRAFGGI